jgi:hypothetical protein
MLRALGKRSRPGGLKRKDFMASRFAALVLLLLVAIGAASRAVAAPTAQQRAEIAALGTLLTRAGNLYKESKFKEAGEIIKDIQSRLERLIEGADEQLVTQVEPIHKRLVNAHALLELEGVTLAELKPLPTKVAAAKPAPGKRRERPPLAASASSGMSRRS